MGDTEQDDGLDAYNDEGSAQGEEESGTEPQTEKAKRRTKNDACERNYKCGCGKDYLSYPALYTHIKQKHGGAHPNGTDTPTIRSGRGRGRPRKQNLPVLPQSRPPNEDEFLRKEELLGGPVDKFDEYYSHSYPGSDKVREKDPIYQAMIQIDPDTISVSSQCVCDEVFALYLIDLASKVSIEGYRLFVSFLRALRECLNLKGWSLEGESNPVGSEEFCQVRNAQNLPEVSNFFITEFVEDRETQYDREKFIGMMLHFNAWLFSHHYSTLKLSLIS